MEPIKTTPDEFIFDMKQYRDKLLIYSQSDVYMVSKADLIEQTTSLSEELRARGEESVDAIYDLSGRKVDFPFSTFNSQLKKKGIYIQNGKKFAVKWEKNQIWAYSRQARTKFKIVINNSLITKIGKLRNK